MKIAVTCPKEPRISFGEISLKYMGRALRETPVKRKRDSKIITDFQFKKKSISEPECIQGKERNKQTCKMFLKPR